jgi:hypothetical protein
MVLAAADVGASASRPTFTPKARRSPSSAWTPTLRVCRKSYI